MKIFFLGPVMMDDYIGGVAVFDEGIARGFSQNGWQVMLLTDQKQAVGMTEKNGVPMKYIGRRSFRSLVREEKPDVIIASLGYARYLKKSMKVKKIYFLHGFFNQRSYGMLKTALAVLYQKWLIKKCDYVFANSHFTRMINKTFFNIRTDGIFYPGVSEAYLAGIGTAPVQKEAHAILFAGRLVGSKNVDMLMRALRILTGEGVEYRICIVGSGKELETVSAMAEEYGIPAVFTGTLSQSGIVEYYRRAEVFVSLNDSEPFGIVFWEALLAGCKIVCPCVGGQTEYLGSFERSVAYVDCYSPDSIAEGIKRMFAEGIAPHPDRKQLEECTYQNIAAYMIDRFLLL